MVSAFVNLQRGKNLQLLSTQLNIDKIDLNEFVYIIQIVLNILMILAK